MGTRIAGSALTLQHRGGTTGVPVLGEAGRPAHCWVRGFPGNSGCGAVDDVDSAKCSILFLFEMRLITLTDGRCIANRARTGTVCMLLRSNAVPGFFHLQA